MWQVLDMTCRERRSCTAPLHAPEFDKPHAEHHIIGRDREAERLGHARWTNMHQNRPSLTDIRLTCSWNTSLSCNCHVISISRRVFGSSLALLTSRIVSCNRNKAFSSSACASGSSHTGVWRHRSSNSRGYLQTLCMG